MPSPNLFQWMLFMALGCLISFNAVAVCALQVIHSQDQEPQPNGVAFRVVPESLREPLAGTTVARLDEKSFEHEAAVAGMRRNAAEALRGAEEAAASTARSHLLAANAAKSAAMSLDSTAEMRRRAEQVQANIAEIRSSFPGKVAEQVEDAVEPAVAAVLSDMNKEASNLIRQQKEARAAAIEEAAKKAERAQAPYRAAEVRTVQAAAEYSAFARQLAQDVLHLHSQAVQLANDAVQAQVQGNKTLAQQLREEAQGLLHEAQPKKLQAEALDKIARQMNRDVPTLDQAAKEAAAFASYEANPAQDLDLQIPALPVPLRLEPDTIMAGGDNSTAEAMH